MRPASTPLAVRQRTKYVEEHARVVRDPAAAATTAPPLPPLGWVPQRSCAARRDAREDDTRARAPSLRRPQIPRRRLKCTSPACAACARSDRCCPTRRQQLARRRPAPARQLPRIVAAAALPPHAAPSCSGPTARLPCLPRSSAAGAREQRGTVLAPNGARCDGLDALVKRCHEMEWVSRLPCVAAPHSGSPRLQSGSKRRAAGRGGRATAARRCRLSRPG